nr:hypothetical protein HK105_006963 [Polyrhizophydium stewartii]
MVGAAPETLSAANGGASVSHSSSSSVGGGGGGGLGVGVAKENGAARRPSADGASEGGGPKKRTKTDETLDKMQFDEGQRDVVMRLIEGAKQHRKPGEVIVVNDARLISAPEANGRNPHSNRAADLQLFLLPQFTPKHHYATIEVRIPAEFLTYRGNIAVRKSALWGTDVYTDDSD